MSGSRCALTDLVSSAILALRSPTQAKGQKGDKSPGSAPDAGRFHLPTIALTVAKGLQVFEDADAPADAPDEGQGD